MTAAQPFDLAARPFSRSRLKIWKPRCAMGRAGCAGLPLRHAVLLSRGGKPRWLAYAVVAIYAASNVPVTRMFAMPLTFPIFDGHRRCSDRFTAHLCDRRQRP